MRLPREIGPIHFIGIGGIGMSGIAEVLCNLGYTVQGSDASESANVERLREKGIKICDRPRRPRTWTAPTCWWSPPRSSATIPELIAARGAAHSRGAPRRDAGRTDAAEKLHRHRRHPRQDHHDVDGRDACSTLAISIRRSSMAASSTPTAPMRGSARATGWWWRPTRATARSSSCRPMSPSSPMSIPSIWITSRPSRRCRRRSAISSRACRSTASR